MAKWRIFFGKIYSRNLKFLKLNSSQLDLLYEKSISANNKNKIANTTAAPNRKVARKRKQSISPTLTEVKLPDALIVSYQQTAGKF